MTMMLSRAGWHDLLIHDRVPPMPCIRPVAHWVLSADGLLYLDWSIPPADRSTRPADIFANAQESAR